MSTEGVSWIIRLWRRTIWHPASIQPEDWKYRSLKRVWLPLYDALVVLTGIWAIQFGSPILREWLPDDTIDLIGLVLTLAGVACLLGVSFPRLWRLEVIGKLIVLSLLTTYAAMIWVLNFQGDRASGFVSFIVCLGIPMLLFRLMLIGEEIKERRIDAERQEHERGQL